MTPVMRYGLSADECARMFAHWYNCQARAACKRLTSFDNWEDFERYFNGKERFAIYTHWVKLGRQVPRIKRSVRETEGSKVSTRWQPIWHYERPDSEHHEHVYIAKRVNGRPYTSTTAEPNGNNSLSRTLHRSLHVYQMQMSRPASRNAIEQY